ncbi:MAG: beta-propeller protein methanol dehydrogenase [Lachnospiraceae bacterium]|jgi:uncharacterized protein|nr:beta-propeller protein methanol dehydrogenase [Lachnospiraceae bacterium]
MVAQMNQIKDRVKNIPAFHGDILSLFTIILILSVFLFHTAIAFAAPEDQKVYDFYGLFTQEEVEELEAIAKEYGDEGQVDIVMITEDTLDGKTRKTYLGDFYDEYGFGYNQTFGDAVLILVNMDPNDRGVEIQGYGDAQYYIHNDRIEYMLDNIVSLLSDGAYFDAMEEFAKQSAYYMNEEKGVNTSPVIEAEGSGNYYGEASYDGPSNYYGEENVLENPLLLLGISALIGAVAVGIMAYQSGGRVTVNSRTYMDGKNSGIVANRDDYIRTVTTRIRKPSNNNRGGGMGRSSGGGGISSGGHSHSGGGRSF